VVDRCRVALGAHRAHWRAEHQAVVHTTPRW
jgi:hypothetical protein